MNLEMCVGSTSCYDMFVVVFFQEMMYTLVT